MPTVKQYQKGGTRKPFELKDERNLVQKDNTPNTKRDLSLMLAEYNNAKKDEQELRTTGQIKNPNSIQYRRNVKVQPQLKQDNISTEQRNAQLSPLERPLIYLANPSKVLGDLGVPGMETSELDRQAIAANRFNPNQTRFQRLQNQVKLGLGYVPEASVNTAMAAAFMPEGTGALGLVNETLNPLAGIKTSIPDELRQGLNTQKFPNPLGIIDKVIPRPLNPQALYGSTSSGWNDLMPLNLLPEGLYGKKLNSAGEIYGYSDEVQRFSDNQRLPKSDMMSIASDSPQVGFRKFGNSINDVIESQSLRPKGAGVGSKQIAAEGNWAEPGKVNENYNGVFEATMNPNVKGSNIKVESWNGRNGVLGTTKEGDVVIPLTDTGLSFNRRLPFSNRYVSIDKQKLIDNKFQIETQLPYLQSLSEKYGLYAGLVGGAGYTTDGVEGVKENIKTLNKYTIDPIIAGASYLATQGQEYTPKFEKGGQKTDKERQAYAFYINRGWTPEQALGIVGNLIRESGLNTTIVGTADDKGSQGVAQWHSGRLKALKNKYGSGWTDFQNQLEFVDWELKNTEKAAGDRLKKTRGVWEAGQVVSDFYERPKVKFVGDERRQRHVADLAMKFKGIKLTPEDNINYGVTFENSVAPYMNAPQVQATPLPTIQVPEMQTQQVSYLEIPQETANLAEETKPSKINPQEEAFMQDLLSQMAEGVGYVEPQKSAVFQDGGVIKIKDSKIQGKGVFLDKSIGKGTTIGLAHTNQQPSTDLGKYHNHSENPNSENIKIGNDRFIVSIKPIKKGEEVTVDYRKQPELEQPEDFKQLTQAEENFLKDIYNTK